MVAKKASSKQAGGVSKKSQKKQHQEKQKIQQSGGSKQGSVDSKKTKAKKQSEHKTKQWHVQEKDQKEAKAKEHAKKGKEEKNSFDPYTLGPVNKQGRIFLVQSKKLVDFPDLLALQKKGFSDFVNDYIHRLFDEINPIQDLIGDQLQVIIDEIQIGEPIHPVDVCKKKELTYGGIISGRVRLIDTANKGKILFNKRANIGILPLMTPQASYIINGVERVIISQIVRSYGIFYTYKDLKYTFKLIPERGPWLEVFIEKSGNVVARINKSRKFPITALLRVFGFETDENIRMLFADTFEEGDTNYLEYTLAKDNTKDCLSAAEHIYAKLRPGELIDAESAVDYIKSQFLTKERMHLGRIARRKINAKLGLEKDIEDPSSNFFDADDLVASIRYLFRLANDHRGYYFDDPDHLSNKRIRTMGEVLYAHLQPVMKKFAKSVKGKLSILNTEGQIKLTDIVNFKIIDNAIKSFFATSQLSQFLDQINPLAEIEHKRRLTALGPGGLKRETAKFDVRDLHPSHYGRICPIETPEGQNIGLVLYQALYSRINKEGFLETPALKVFHEVPPIASKLVHRIARRNIYALDEKGNPTKKLLVAEDTMIDEKTAKEIEKYYSKTNTYIKVKAFFTDEIEYISPELDEKSYIADLTCEIDEYNNIIQDRVPGRHFDEMKLFHVNDITHIDVNPAQLFSANTSLIPFVNHNDAVRAMIATNQHRQGVPLVRNEAPLVGTGLEADILGMTHAVIFAEGEGEVIYVDGKRVKVKYKEKDLGTKEYELQVFQKSNQKTCVIQKPKVALGQKVQKGDILAEGPCADNGEMAIGKNLRVAFMPWEGYNYEDAIVISKRLVKDDDLTSIHIEDFEVEVCDTKLGPEETTNDIPGVSLSKLKNLDEDGIVRIGSVVQGGDILVGKITPKSEGELSPEEKLIQAIFGDRSKSVKDTSLYLPAGLSGKVIEVVVLDAKKGDNLMAGIRKKIKVYVAMTRKIEVGDKLAAKHGNKGIISIVVPEEDMPYTEDGQPIDLCLNPLGVISRMNMGQVFETHLGLIAKTLGVKFAVPIFSNFGSQQIKDLATKIGLPPDLKMTVYDGRTGEPYPNKVTVGYMHMLKLSHMVEDKIHARAVGPYSLITQQPLGGKARDGGQRFGEMEVWALEAYSAVYTLQEMLTIKSDDVLGRNKTYEAIIKGNKPKVLGLPESFNYLVYLLKGLCQDVVPLTKEEIDQIHQERIKKIIGLGLSGITGSVIGDLDDISSGNEKVEDEQEEKEDMINSVIEELADAGELEDEEV